MHKIVFTKRASRELRRAPKDVARLIREKLAQVAADPHAKHTNVTRKKDGRPEWAVVPYETYEQLVRDAEMLQDVRDYDEARQALAEGEELVPADVIYALLDGENPVRVWREHRRLSQQEVAERTGISVPYLSQIESGRRKGTTGVLAALARVLGVTLDDLVDKETSRHNNL